MLTMLFIGPVPVFTPGFTIAFAWNAILLHTQVTHLHHAPRDFSRDFIYEWLDDLWELRDNLSMEIDWSYEMRMNQLTKKVQRNLIDPHVAEKQRLQYEFTYTSCVQNLETSLENLDGLRDTASYVFEQAPPDHPSTHAHYQDLLHTLEQQEKGLQLV